MFWVKQVDFVWLNNNETLEFEEIPNRNRQRFAKRKSNSDERSDKTIFQNGQCKSIQSRNRFYRSISSQNSNWKFSFFSIAGSL